MARRLVIASQKGGVGKTTVALNLAVSLAEKGRRTLLVDLDPQGGVGLSLAKGDAELAGLAELLMNQAEPTQAVMTTQLPGLRLLPRGRLDPTDVSGYELEVGNPANLEAALVRVEGGADVVILDTPSGLGRVTAAALAVSDFVLLPFQTESLSLRSVSQCLRVIEHIQGSQNPKLRLLGILPTLVERDRPSALGVLGEIWNGFPDALETIVPRAEAFARASEQGIPVAFLAGATTAEARRFDLLADELDARMDRIHGMERPDETKPARQLL
jgi:chromosome partitioning protein